MAVAGAEGWWGVDRRYTIEIGFSSVAAAAAAATAAAAAAADDADAAAVSVF